jgi:hypothetical protein
MREPQTNWRQSLIAAAAVMMLLALAIAEVAASHVDGLVGDPTAPWVGHIQKVEEALAKKNISAAERAWHEAYVAALGSRRWEGMVEAADAALRIADAVGVRKASEAKARGIYLTALLRARQERSLDGVLRVAEAFAVLGDQEVVNQCIRIADHLALQARNAEARDRVRAFRARVASRFLGVENYRVDEF